MIVSHCIADTVMSAIIWQCRWPARWPATITCADAWQQDVAGRRVDLDARAGGEATCTAAVPKDSVEESAPPADTPESPALLNSRFYSCPGDTQPRLKRLSGERNVYLGLASCMHGKFKVNVCQRTGLLTVRTVMSDHVWLKYYI